MRLSPTQTEGILDISRQLAGDQVRVRVFGSRLDDEARGGDLDLLLEVHEPVPNPALMSARIAARITRLLDGRKVDVLLSAPNLMRLPIHDSAFRKGVLL